MSYFIVGKESNRNYQEHGYNLLTWPVSIVFMVNMKLINEPLLDNMIFTQNLIQEVRRVITDAFPVNSKYFIRSIEREFNEVFREFTLDEFRRYQTAPYDAFRLNLDIEVR